MDEECPVDHHEREAHCLNLAARHVWHLCDGRTSPVEMARQLGGEREQAEAVVGLALEQLASRHLIDDFVPPFSETKCRGRRSALRRMAAALLPVVASLAVPSPASAASAVAMPSCTNDGQCASLISNMG